MQISMRRFFLKIAKNSEYINTFCNNPYEKFRFFCHECYLYDLIKSNPVEIKNWMKFYTITIEK